MVHKSRKAVLQELKLSNEGSFKELSYKYHSRLCRYAYYILGNKQWAEDVVQSFFARIWEQREDLEIEGKMENYLFVSVRNASYNFLKSNLLQKMRETEYVMNQTEDKSRIDKESFFKKLQEALGRLPEQCREIYCLKNMEGLTYKEIADYLQISEKTVDVQIYRALKKLRELMAVYKNAFYL
ncbi:MAG: RNA polymerase sigma-70 factor [Bacteroidales bacterium]|nr:RNA polymerase sigma-70 factor [Bacteroidales bacterium]